MPKRTRSYDSWLLKELTDPVVAANYINAASEDSDEMLLVAVRNVAEAHKMSRVAREASVNRVSLYKTLSSGGNPLLGNYRNIMSALGLKLLVVPKQSANAPSTVKKPKSGTVAAAPVPAKTKFNVTTTGRPYQDIVIVAGLASNFPLEEEPTYGGAYAYGVGSRSWDVQSGPPLLAHT